MATQRLTIWPNRGKTGDQPDLYLRAKDPASEKQKDILTVGAAWENDSPVGKYYSAELGGRYNEDVWLITAKEYSEYQKLKRKAQDDGDEGYEDSIPYPENDENITPEDIPF